LRRFKARTDDEIKADLAKISNERIRWAYFVGVVKEWDKLDINSERRHNSHRHIFDIMSIEGSFGEDDENHTVPAELMYYCEEFTPERLAFTEKAEYIHEIVPGAALCRILKNLTDCQREALFLRSVKLLDTGDISRMNKITPRAVRKHYELALWHIRSQLLPVVKLKRKIESSEIYREIAIKSHISTTFNERWFIELSKGKYDGYYS